MLKFIVKRVLVGLMTLFIIVSVTFFLLQIMPGTPFNDDKLSEYQISIMKEAYGLGEPVVVQYKNYILKMFQGDFGTSFRYDNQKVADLIKDRLLYTTWVGMEGLVFGLIVGIVLGALAALKRNSVWDSLVVVIAIIGVSVPSFVIGALLQLGVGVKLGLLPVAFDKTFASSLMPAFALSLFVISSTARFMRTELVEVLGSDYILLARAKGLSNLSVIYKHAIRNALIPVVTLVGPLALSLLTGSVVIESIFGVPGVSFLMVEAVNRNDYFVILGIATFYSALYIAILIITDILYGVIDPRIRVGGGAN